MAPTVVFFHAHPDDEAGSTVLGLDAETFAGVYGYEWYVRTGPPGALDAIAM